MVFTTLNQLQYIPRHFFQFLTNILSIYILCSIFQIHISVLLAGCTLQIRMLLSVGPKTHEKVVNWLIYWSHNWSQKHTKIFGISCVNISYLYFTTLYFGAIFKVASVTLVDSCHWCHRPPFQILGNQSSFARWPSTKVLSNLIFNISLQIFYISLQIYHISLQNIYILCSNIWLKSSGVHNCQIKWN